MKKLFCDIDSTINDHWKRIQKHTYNNKCNWDKAFSREEIMKDSPLPGAKEALQMLSKEYEIHFLTARPFKDAYSITKTWLDQNGFIYESIIVVNKSMDKLNYVKEPNCLFIDDLSRKHETYPPYTILYKDTISLLNNHNVNYIIFKGDWDEIINKVIK